MAIEPFINCSDIAISVKFYTEILDFSVHVEPHPEKNTFMSKYALLGWGDDLLHLSSHEGDGVFGNLIYIRVDDVAMLYEKYVANGINTNEPEKFPAVTIKLIEQTWGMREFSVRDPDGNKITFGQQIAS